VLIASANATLRRRIAGKLDASLWPIEEAGGGADALGKLECSDCRLLLLDEHLPDLDARELTAMIRAQYPGVDVLVLDSQTGAARAVSALQTGAAEVLLNALRPDVLHGAEARNEAQPGTPRVEPLPGMVGCGAAMQRVYRMVRLVAPRDTAVLVTGDSGSGKELVAQAVHKLSHRSRAPFVAINCAAIPESLLESELFGYVRGAFTGAVQSRMGRIHAAQGGTLFLDEIGDLPLNLQAKILRFLEQGEVQRLGSNDVFRVDVRVVAATNSQLEQKVAKQEFRKDLFYRLAVFPIELPPLNHRKEDIPELAQHFLQQMSPRLVLNGDAIRVLVQHEWAGNVRELRHVIERAVIMAEGDPEILPEHILLSGVPALRS